jgi:hypothetical protein
MPMQQTPLRIGKFIQMQHVSTGLWLHQVNPDSGSGNGDGGSSSDSNVALGVGCDEKHYLRIEGIRYHSNQKR